jgi:hypothetical protein
LVDRIIVNNGTMRGWQVVVAKTGREGKKNGGLESARVD